MQKSKFNLKAKKKIYVVGNPLVKADCLPVKLLPQLRKTLPLIEFTEVDPTENFIPENDAVIMDAVVGIKRVQWFHSLDDFVATRSASVHDYDLSMHLQLLLKIKKINRVKILGIPQFGKENQILKEVKNILTESNST